MKTFLLILAVVTHDGEGNVSATHPGMADRDEFVLDYNLTLDDCMEALGTMPPSFQAAAYGVTVAPTCTPMTDEDMEAFNEYEGNADGQE